MTTEILEGGRRIDDNGIIMPWYTSPCLEWLEKLDFHNTKVFEFGVGDSTAWYRSKGCKVHGVESDKYWAEKCQVDCCQVGYIPSGYSYIDSIVARSVSYDIVVIDGDMRDYCTENALIALKSGGYLILDNYKQESVEPNWPLTEKLIEGMPITLYFEPNHWDKWCTAVIKKP